jgi:hypothetical protein
VADEDIPVHVFSPKTAGKDFESRIARKGEFHELSFVFS